MSTPQPGGLMPTTADAWMPATGRRAEGRRRAGPSIGGLWTVTDALTGQRQSATELPTTAGSTAATTQAVMRAGRLAEEPSFGLRAVTAEAGGAQDTNRGGGGSASAGSRIRDLNGTSQLSTESDATEGERRGPQPESTGHPSPQHHLNPVQDWNRLALDITKRARRGPTISARLSSLINTALYDSHAIFSEDETGYIFNLDDHSPLKPKGDDSSRLQTATMAVASHRVLLDVGASLFGAAGLPQDLKDRADELLQTSLQTLFPGQGQAVGQARKLETAQGLGQAAADAILAFAWADGSNQRNNYADTSGYQPQPSGFDPNNPRDTLDNSWQPLPVPGPTPSVQKALTPHWGSVQVLAGDASLVPTTALTPLDSQGEINPDFVDQLNGVLTTSMNLTAEQKASAEYWEQGNGTTYPPGKWLEMALSRLEQSNYSQTQSVQQMFAISQALHSAAVLAWEAKFDLDTIRPITAIQQYYSGRTTLDDGITLLSDWRNQPILGQNWKPYLTTPAFPEVVSGHSTFSAAAGYIMSTLFGNNASATSVTLTDSQSRVDPNGFDGIAGVGDPITLNWNYVSEQTESAGQSRIYGGIHFEEGNLQGQILGYKIGNAVLASAQSLFGAEEAQALTQKFGTMGADILGWDPITNINAEEEESQQQIYGFAGDDLLIAGGNAAVQLFGGDGQDRFRLSAGSHGAWIRDYQPGVDVIEIAAFDPHNPIDLGRISLSSNASMGSFFTELKLRGDTLAILDGNWGRQDINLVALA